jgi:hypothetical protein
VGFAYQPHPVEEGEKTGECTTGMHSNLFVTLPTAMAPVTFAPGSILVCAPLANMVALAARTLQRTIFPPKRTDIRLALFGVEEVMYMGEYRHG